MALPVLSAQFKLARTWLYNRNWHINELVNVFYLCNFDSFSAQVALTSACSRGLNLNVSVDGLGIRDLPQQHHWHIDYLVTVLNLRNLDVLCHLIDLLWPLGVLDGIHQFASHSASS